MKKILKFQRAVEKITENRNFEKFFRKYGEINKVFEKIWESFEKISKNILLRISKKISQETLKKIVQKLLKKSEKHLKDFGGRRNFEETGQ